MTKEQILVMLMNILHDARRHQTSMLVDYGLLLSVKNGTIQITPQDGANETFVIEVRKK